MSSDLEKRLAAAEKALADEQASLGDLEGAYEQQVKRVEQLRAAANRDLEGVSLDSLMGEADSVLSSGQALGVAKTVLSEIERRKLMQSEMVAKAQQACNRAHVDILASEAWQLEEGIYQSIMGDVADNLRRLREIQERIHNLVGVTRDMAFPHYMLELPDRVEHDFTEHRGRRTPLSL
jgi:hypothetical protein